MYYLSTHTHLLNRPLPSTKLLLEYLQVQVSGWYLSSSAGRHTTSIFVFPRYYSLWFLSAGHSSPRHDLFVQQLSPWCSKRKHNTLRPLVDATESNLSSIQPAPTWYSMGRDRGLMLSPFINIFIKSGVTDNKDPVGTEFHSSHIHPFWSAQH